MDINKNIMEKNLEKNEANYAPLSPISFLIRSANIWPDKIAWVHGNKNNTYKQLLDTFFELHDPTTLNRQGPDVGTQYRSAIFYNNSEEKKLAEDTIDEINESGKFQNKIVTEVESATNFYSAEDYHQDYYKKRGLTSCAI